MRSGANIAVADIGSPGLSSSHEASIRFLLDLEHLATLAQSLNVPGGIAPETLRLYANGRMESVQSRKTTIIASLASELAAGKEMSSSNLGKLQTLRAMLSSLGLAGEVETGLAKADLLTRWVDWSISPAQLRALVSPYRDATAAAFAGFADDDPTPLGRWHEVQSRFAPILLLVREVGSYSQQCADLPGGLPGEFAKLMTPMDKQPFGIERYASLAVGTWQRAAEATDARTADGIFDAMLTRLRRDLRVSERD